MKVKCSADTLSTTDRRGGPGNTLRYLKKTDAALTFDCIHK